MTKCQSSQAATEHFVFLFIQFHHKADIPDCHPYAGSASTCAEKQLFGRQIPSLVASLAAASIQSSELCVLAAAVEKYLRLSAAAA